MPCMPHVLIAGSDTPFQGAVIVLQVENAGADTRDSIVNMLNDLLTNQCARQKQDLTPKRLVGSWWNLSCEHLIEINFLYH